MICPQFSTKTNEAIGEDRYSFRCFGFILEGNLPAIFFLSAYDQQHVIVDLVAA